MQITLNGEQIDIEQKTLLRLIVDMGLESKVMAAAINMQVVKKEDWDKALLKESDKIELLQFVGGG